MNAYSSTPPSDQHQHACIKYDNQLEKASAGVPTTFNYTAHLPHYLDGSLRTRRMPKHIHNSIANCWTHLPHHIIAQHAILSKHRDQGVRIHHKQQQKQLSTSGNSTSNSIRSACSIFSVCRDSETNRTVRLQRHNTKINSCVVWPRTICAHLRCGR